jgi:hypothetical protein
MEGGIAILLLLMIVAVGGVCAVLFTSLGGALSLQRRKDSKDEAADEGRPVHTHPTTPYHEHTRFTHPEREDARTEAKSTRD